MGFGAEPVKVKAPEAKPSAPGAKAPAQPSGVARPQGQQALPQGYTEDQAQQVRLMQQLLRDLGVGIETRADNTGKYKNILIRPYSTAIQNTQAGAVGPNQFDGKWATNTDGAVKKAQELAEKLGHKDIKLTSGISWRRTSADDVKKAAEHNIEELKKFLRLEGIGSAAAGEDKKNEIQTIYLDWLIPANGLSDAGSYPDRDPPGTAGKIAVIADYLGNISNFYDFCQQLRRRGMVPAEFRTKRALQEIAGLIKSSLIVKNPFEAYAQTFLGDDSKANARFNERAKRDKRKLDRKKEKPKYQREQAARTGRSSGERRDETIDFDEGRRSSQQKNPAAPAAAPTAAEKPQYNQNWLTVAELDYCIAWFTNRSFNVYQVLQQGGVEGKDPRTGKEITQRDIQISMYYNELCKRLRGSWDAIRGTFLLDDAGKPIDPKEAYVDPSMIGAGGTGVARGQGGRRGRGSEDEGDSEYGKGGEGFDAQQKAARAKQARLTLSFDKDAIDILYIAKLFNTSTRSRLNQMMGVGVLDKLALEQTGTDADMWFSNYANPRYVKGNPIQFTINSINLILETLREAFNKWQAEYQKSMNRADRDTIDDHLVTQQRALQEWLKILGRFRDIAQRAATKAQPRSRYDTWSGRPVVRR